MAAISTPALVINNVTFPYKPNSVSFTEGKAEYKIRTAAAGGTKTERVFSENIETAYGKVKGVFYTTSENIEEARRLKDNKDTNVVQLVDGSFSRTFNKATVINDPEIPTGFEGEFELEFHTDPAI